MSGPTSESENRGREKVLQERLDCVARISKAISTTLDLDELLILIMDQVTAIMGADRSTLFLIDQERGELWSKVIKGEDKLTIRLPKGVGIAGQVALEGKILNIPDAYEHPAFNPDVDRQTGYRTRSILAVPVSNNRGALTGVVQVLNRLDGRPFDGDDVALLEALVSQISMAIENAKLYRRAVTRNLELDALYDIEQEVSSAHDPESLIHRVLEKAIGIIGAEAGSILLKSGTEEGQLFFHSAKGGQGRWLQGRKVALGKGIVGWVARQGRPARVNDVSRDERFDPTLAEMIEYPVRQILAVPLSDDEETIGAVEMINCVGKKSFTDEDERLLRLLGAQIARAVNVARRARERHQRERLEAIGRMLAGVIHDLRTPMTVITASLELMVDEKDRERRNVFAERALNQFDVIGQMTKDLLAFARGERHVYMRKVYMQKFLGDLAGMVDPEAGGRGVTVTWDRAYEGAAFFDPDLVRRALLNLVRNAFQAMPKGGRLAIGSAAEDGELIFTVSDDGPGIPEAIRDSLFEAFVTSGKEDGTGLGLAIVKRAVEDHRGTVTVESEKDRGTTFTLRLPLEPPER